MRLLQLWSGVEIEDAELYSRPGRMIIAAPTNEGQMFTVVYWPNGEFHDVRADIEGSLMGALGLVPELAERLRAFARSASAVRESCPTSTVARTATGGRWSATPATTRIRSRRSA